MQKFLEAKITHRYKKSEIYIAKLIVSYLDFGISNQKYFLLPKFEKSIPIKGDPNTIYQCFCGDIVPFEDLNEHKELDCKLSNRKCLACGETRDTKDKLLGHKEYLCFYLKYTCKFCKADHYYSRYLFNHYKDLKEASYCYLCKEYCEICNIYYNKEYLELHKYCHF